MLERDPVGPVGLALKKAGGAADADQLSATTGLPRKRVLADLGRLEAAGLVINADGTWKVSQVV